MLVRIPIIALLFFMLGTNFGYTQGVTPEANIFDSKLYNTSLSISKDSSLAVAVQYPHQGVYVYSLKGTPSSIAVINGFVSPRSVVFSSESPKNFYVTDSSRGVVLEIAITDEGYSVVRSVALEKGVFGMLLDAKRQRLYVTNPTEGSLSILDVKRWTVVKKMYGFNGVQQAIALNPSETRVYCGSPINNSITIVDAKTLELVTTIEDVPNVTAIAVNDSGARIYATSAINNLLLVYSTVTYKLVATIPVGSAPKGVTIGVENNAVIVANTEGKSLSVLNTLNMNLERVIPLSVNPTGAIIASVYKKTFDLLYLLDVNMNVLVVNWPMGLIQAIAK